MTQLYTRDGDEFFVTKDINEVNLYRESDFLNGYFQKIADLQKRKCGYYIVDENKVPIDDADGLDECYFAIARAINRDELTE